jgi:hypothetical protein
MSGEWRRWLIVAAAALTVGTLGARSYVRLAIPYYDAVARLTALWHPWQIEAVQIAARSGRDEVLELTGTVRRRIDDPQPAARLVAKLQIAAAVEAPVIFWCVLLGWPVTGRWRRLNLLLAGLPMFLALEAATTVCQLLAPLAYASAVLAGATDPVTAWEHWSRFLEAGGRVVLALGAALCAVAMIRVNVSSAVRQTGAPSLAVQSDEHQQQAERWHGPSR